MIFPIVLSRKNGEKEVFIFNRLFNQRFSAQTGFDLIVKRYADSERVRWMNAYWDALNRAAETDASLPKGEITARTEKSFILSVYFGGGNLCYDHLAEEHERSLDREVARLLLEKNRALIPFTEAFLEREGVLSYDEGYGKKMGESLRVLAGTGGKRAERKVEHAYAGERGRFEHGIYGGAARVPFTDLKTPNLVLEKGASLEDAAKGRGDVEVVDDDKLDCRIVLAHNLAHIIFDPGLSLDFEERMELLGEEGLLDDGKEKGSLLAVGYYLTRQAALMLDGPDAQVPSWKETDRRRFEGFYESMLGVLCPLSREYRWADELGRMLPASAPPWRS